MIKMPNHNYDQDKLMFTVIMLSILLFGSLYHISSICMLFFSYPTNIFIETKFDSYDRQLPSMTFCCNIQNITRGKTTTELFGLIEKDKYIHNVYTTYSHEPQVNLTQFVLDHLFESISLNNYCFTINSQLTG